MKSLTRKLIVLLFFIYPLLIVPSIVQGQTVGVQEGDWFKYDYSYNFTSYNSSANTDDFTIGDMKLEWVMYSILEVSLTNVTVETKFHYINGTEQAWTNTIDPNESFIFSPDSSEINGTIMRTYDSGLRETEWQTTNKVNSGELHQILAQETVYWDKEIGIFVESETIVEKRSTDGSELLAKVTVSGRIIDSNLDSIPEFPSWIILPIFLTATILPLVFRKRLIS